MYRLSSWLGEQINDQVCLYFQCLTPTPFTCEKSHLGASSLSLLSCSSATEDPQPRLGGSQREFLLRSKLPARCHPLSTVLQSSALDRAFQRRAACDDVEPSRLGGRSRQFEGPHGGYPKDLPATQL